MEMKKEMMLNAIQLGLNMGAEGCIAMLSREELEILANAGNEKVAKEKEKEIIVQVYVDMIADLIDKLEALGYDVMVQGQGYNMETLFDIDINHDEKLIYIV
jgi:hypothetical protein